MTATFHSKNPALQDSILVFNQDCELVSQLPIYFTTHGVVSRSYFTLIFMETVFVVPFFNVTFAFTVTLPFFFAVILPFLFTVATDFCRKCKLLS